MIPPTDQVSSREQEEVLKPVKEGPTQRLGRKPLWLKYPEIVPCATDFIKQQSFAAHARRRKSTRTGTGVTLRDLKQHLLDTVPGLKDHGISVDTVHHLMVAPRKNSSHADRYKGLIDAKVAAKKNNYREGCENQHFLFARVNYREELCSKFHEEACFYSSDDMNKLRMGPSTAVSRYHQQNRFFMRNDMPNLWDHDFPHAGYLITTSGYQMQVKEEVCDNQSNRDNEIYTREDLNDYSVNPDSGDFQDLNATAREVDLANIVPNVKFTSSSGQTHANDILPILTAQVKEGKTVAFVKVDNGSDWSVRSVVNSIYFCRLWKDSGLDILGIVSYAAKYSAYNQIEHLWSPMSKKLSSVILLSVLGDDVAPCLQKELETEERRLKDAKVFDNAMALVRDKYWKDATFNGSKITTLVKKSLEEESPYHDYNHVHEVKKIC